MRIKTIGITFNLKKEGVYDDRYEEYDEIQTIESIKHEIESYGFKVLLLEQHESFLKDIVHHRPDFIFNIAEGVGNTRGRESQVPSIAESLDIPYSGSDPIALGITLDKYLTNRLLASVSIPVPYMAMVKELAELDALAPLFERYGQLIVKPRWEGSSKGIFSHSVVNRMADLKERVTTLLVKYEQPVLIEEFLEHDEITVGLCGNGPSRQVLGMMRIVPVSSDEGPFIYSIENKRDWKKKIKYESQDIIESGVKKTLKEYAFAAFDALELRDISRIDFRLGTDKVPKIIDINPLPGLSPSYSDLVILYKLCGGTYSLLIKHILNAAFARLGFSPIA